MTGSFILPAPAQLSPTIRVKHAYRGSSIPGSPAETWNTTHNKNDISLPYQLVLSHTNYLHPALLHTTYKFQLMKTASCHSLPSCSLLRPAQKREAEFRVHKSVRIQKAPLPQGV